MPIGIRRIQFDPLVGWLPTHSAATAHRVCLRRYLEKLTQTDYK